VLPADVATAAEQDDETDAELRRMGVSDEQIRAGRAVRAVSRHAAPVAPQPWPWHMDAARVFGAMRRQWRVVPGGTSLYYLGLDFSALAECRRMLRIRARPELMDQLRVMESAGLEALNDSQG
jgi:hypothetical protein